VIPHSRLKPGWYWARRDKEYEIVKLVHYCDKGLALMLPGDEDTWDPLLWHFKEEVKPMDLPMCHCTDMPGRIAVSCRPKWSQMTEIEKAATLYVKAKHESAIMAIHLACAKQRPDQISSAWGLGIGVSATVSDVEAGRKEATLALRRAWKRLDSLVPSRHDLWFLGYDASDDDDKGGRK